MRCTIHAAITLTKWDIVNDKLDELTRFAAVQNSSDEIFLRGLYLSGTASLEDAVHFLQNQLSGKEEEKFAECWILLGELYWKLTKVENALDSFLRVRLVR